MALVLADRVKETTGSTGTGDVSLSGATTGFQRFADAVGDSNTTYYAISLVGGGEFEVGLGTYIAATNSLRRDTVFQSSNSNSLVDFSTGTKDVFVVYPSDRAVVVEGTTVNIPNSATVPVTSGGTGASTASTARSNLGLGSIATQDASNVNLDGGSITGTDVDVSGATFTIANDQISGDAINGGTATPTALNVDSGTLFVNSANNRVGIGTSSPDTNLHVIGLFQEGGILVEDSSSSTASPAIKVIGKRSDANTSSSFGGKIALAKNRTDRKININNTIGSVYFGGNHTDASLSNILYSGQISGIAEGDFNSSSDMPTGIAFYTGTSGVDLDTPNTDANPERMRIDSSGNVGIGDSNPPHNLSVEDINPTLILKDTRTGSLGGDTNGSILFYNNDNSNDGGARVTASVKQVAEYEFGRNSLVFGTYTTISKAAFGDPPDYTDGTIERMRIDSSGNVGIGTSSPSSTLDVNGSLSKNSGSFRIDHPLPEKSETHNLVHSFVESPRADNVYRGTATLSNGTAQVNLDAYVGMTEGTFSALNGNIDVFLQNKTGWEPLKGEVIDNILHVYCRDETAIDTISWMVVGERQDQHMLDTNWTDEFGRPVLEPEKEIEQEIPDDE